MDKKHLSVTVAPQGRVVLPSELRQELGIREGDRLAVERRDDAILLRLEIAAKRSNDWRSWRGTLAGSNALQDHLAEHADEVRRDQRLP